MDKLIRKVLRKYLKEAIDLKPGQSFKFPDQNIGRKILRMKYGVNPDDFEYVGGGKFVYKSKSKASTPRQTKPKKQKEFLGRKEGETEQDYLERVRELNKNFADVESEIPGEDWRPVKNTGRYFGGSSDYSRSHEVSNMGRIRTIDYNDPMRSRISTGYDAPTRNSRQFHLDTFDDNGEAFKTTPPIHTLVADAWLDAPEGNIEDYDVEHIDGNYHNNRADNLRYVLRKGRRGRKAEVAESKINKYNKNRNMKHRIRLTESDLRNIVKSVLNNIVKKKEKDPDAIWKEYYGDDWEYQKSHQQTYLPRGWDKYCDRNGKINWEKLLRKENGNRKK